jgi:hypothetical protein
MPAGGELAGSGAEQSLDGASFAHGLVAFGGLREGELEVEDLAWSIVRFQIRSISSGQGAADRGGAVQVDVGEEQFLARQFDVVRDADVADVAAGAGGTDGLHHRLLSADCLPASGRRSGAQSWQSSVAFSVGNTAGRSASSAGSLGRIKGAKRCRQALPWLFGIKVRRVVR